jgi:hypothetical protein
MPGARTSLKRLAPDNAPEPAASQHSAAAEQPQALLSSSDDDELSCGDERLSASNDSCASSDDDNPMLRPRLYAAHGNAVATPLVTEQLKRDHRSSSLRAQRVCA